MDLTKSFEKAKETIESMYYGTCDIIEYVDVYDDTTKKTSKTEKTVYTNEPCRLSYNTISYNTESDTTSEKNQIIELFISPDIQINPGSKIVVTQNGITTSYKNSGQPSIYKTQQSIILELFDDWS